MYSHMVILLSGRYFVLKNKTPSGQHKKGHLAVGQDDLPQRLRGFFRDYFVPHLKSELPEELKTELFYIVVEKQPYLLIETLRLLAARKTFKGTCPVCKDW